jgi:hypothetical protein
VTGDAFGAEIIIVIDGEMKRMDRESHLIERKRKMTHLLQ